jgi:small-conductance mechanosensitive channel
LHFALESTILERAVQDCESIQPRPAPVIRLIDASSIPYRYSLWVHFDGYMASFAGREELFSRIHTTFEEAGVAVTAEVQDVRYERLGPNVRAQFSNDS